MARLPQRRLEMAAEDRRGQHDRAVELTRGGQVRPEAAAEPHQRQEPREHRAGEQAARGEHAPGRPDAVDGGGEPQRKEQDEDRLAKPADQAEDQRAPVQVRHAAADGAQREQRHQRGAEGLAGVGQPHGAVEPEQRAHREQQRRGHRRGPPVERAGQPVHGERRRRAEQHGQRHVGLARIADGRVEQAAEAHVEEVAGRVRLVLGDVELAERERELHGVPVVEHPRPVGPARRQRDQGQRDAARRSPWRARAASAARRPRRHEAITSDTARCDRHDAIGTMRRAGGASAGRGAEKRVRPSFRLPSWRPPTSPARPSARSRPS